MPRSTKKQTRRTTEGTAHASVVIDHDKQVGSVVIIGPLHVESEKDGGIWATLDVAGMIAKFKPEDFTAGRNVAPPKES